MSKRIKEIGLGKAKKALRKNNKEGLRDYYVMVKRTPLEKGLRTYTKLMSVAQAAGKLYGKLNSIGTKVESSRTYKAV